MAGTLNVNLGLNDVLALWGGITGTISLTITYLTFWRDRAKIKVEVSKNWLVKGPSSYDPNEEYVRVSVMNSGRRPVTITTVGYVSLKRKGGAILADCIKRGPVELSEGKSIAYLTLQKAIDFEGIGYFAAYDAIGNTYKKWITNWWVFFFFWLLDVLGILKKQPARRQKASG